MNGYQRIRAALRGESPDTTPIMLHNFMLAAREAGITMEQYRRDPHAIARCLIESVEKYGLDGLLVDVDTATLAGALGVDVELPEDQPALSPPGSLVPRRQAEAAGGGRRPGAGRHSPIQPRADMARGSQAGIPTLPR